jgi:menaquinone-9 beta-reductase
LILRKVAIIGGGLAGLISAIQLAQAGVSCILIEKKQYPFHRVCGEYISNEAVEFLKRINAYPAQFEPSQVNKLQLSSVQGHSATMPLDLGGFGISRFSYDHYLFLLAKKSGVELLTHTEIIEVKFSQDSFTLTTNSTTINVDCVIGAFGKRSKLDVQLNRDFIKKRSPFVGVKYHAKTDHPKDVIALHNFEGGYCGVCAIEDGKTNLCYLTHRDNIKAFGDIRTMERNVLYKNPLLKNIFENADFIFDKPEVINEVSFETKAPVENHMLMTGDAAGMITPLCGNGMAMAIHSAKIASELLIEYSYGRITRGELEFRYTALWKKHFAKRLWTGKQVQKLFGNASLSALAINLMLYSKPVAGYIIRNTHGQSF